MSTSAFIPTISRGLVTSTCISSFTPAQRTPVLRRTAAYTARRLRLRMSEETPVTDTKPVDPSQTAAAPSLDTTVFSDFVDSAQAKIEDMQQQIQDIDTDILVSDASEAGKGLIDNLLAGDWLNRGELYGGIQLLLVYFLIRAPGLLDGVVSLLFGPILLLVGGFASGKAVLDLGRKQLSIWPAPVPNGELKTEGLYQIVRHPIYSGLLLASLGYSAMTGSPSRFAITAAFAFFLLKKVAVEEDFLLDTYPEYEKYCEDVPFKILPRIF